MSEDFVEHSDEFVVKVSDAKPSDYMFSCILPHLFKSTRLKFSHRSNQRICVLLIRIYQETNHLFSWTQNVLERPSWLVSNCDHSCCHHFHNWNAKVLFTHSVQTHLASSHDINEFWSRLVDQKLNRLAQSKVFSLLFQLVKKSCVCFIACNPPGKVERQEQVFSKLVSKF